MDDARIPRRAGPAILEAFGALASEHGLSPEPFAPFEREATFVFAGPGARLEVWVEAGCDSWVAVQATGAARFGLHELIDPARAGELARLPDEAGLDHLRRLAALTGEAADDLLRGDTRRLTELRRARIVRRREESRATFGTATGESRRFEERPSLEDLFADARNDGIVDARCYQAVWDWAFSVDALAAHLGESPDAVRARLDRWESLG